jgi:hypothetical protein
LSSFFLSKFPPEKGERKRRERDEKERGIKKKKEE